MTEKKNNMLADASLLLTATKMLPVAEIPQPKRQRLRKPSLVSVAKQASKAAIEVKQYEVRPDGTIVVITGKTEEYNTTNTNPWDEVLHERH